VISVVALPEEASPVNPESATRIGDFSVLGFIAGDRSVDAEFAMEYLSAPIILGPTLGEPKPMPSGFFTASSTGEEVLLKILLFCC
jgi:hypothetical protein